MNQLLKTCGIGASNASCFFSPLAATPIQMSLAKSLI